MTTPQPFEEKEELWRKIPGYRHYEVSNYGRVRSLDRKTRGRWNTLKTNKGCILKPEMAGPGFATGKGYPSISLCKGGVCKPRSVHRLVAHAFVKNPLNKNMVNHINGIKTDNRVENLEWCTNSENQYHAVRLGLRPVTEKQRENGRKLAKMGQDSIKKIKQLLVDEQKKLNKTILEGLRSEGVSLEDNRVCRKLVKEKESDITLCHEVLNYKINQFNRQIDTAISLLEINEVKFNPSVT